MKHQIQLCRNGDLTVTITASDRGKANEVTDKLIQEVHFGVHGIGEFQIFIYEVALEGHIERCVTAYQPFRLPHRETA